MPCMKQLALAFDKFAASFKIEHSSAFSGVPSTLTPSILGAVSFTAIMAIATFQFLKSRAWFLWALTGASILQCAGFIASAVHSQDGQNHVAFLASFGTITMAPLLLSIAVFTTFARLSQVVTPEHVKQTRSLWVFLSQRCGTFVLLPCMVPFAMFASAIFNVGKFLSPIPIEGRSQAFMRLLYYELGLSQLEKAHASQAIICFAFAIVVNVFASKSKQWEVSSLGVKNKNWRELLYTLNTVNLTVLCRALYKAYETREIVASRSSLGDNGVLFWLCDVLPMLAALVSFCAVKPTSYLPEDSPSIILDPEALYADEKTIPDYSGAQF